MITQRRIEAIGIWCGVAMAVLTLVGAVLVGRFIPPFAVASDSAAAVAAEYADRAARVRIGAVLSNIGLALILPFGAAIAVQCRRAEGARPLLTYVQVASIAVASVLVVLACTIWALAAFRPGVYPPELVRFANDLAYFIFIFTWPPFSIWFAAIALGTFTEGSPSPFPRWIGYLCLWLAVQISGGAMIAFFKTGPFAFQGLLALYVPVALFFVWVIAMTRAMLANLDPVDLRAREPLR